MACMISTTNYLEGMEKDKLKEPCQTCIVNDIDRGAISHHRSSGTRCKKTRLRLAYRLPYHPAGWFPDTNESVNCERYEKHNCIELINGTVRRSAVRIRGRDHCAEHAASLCKQELGEGLLCAELAWPGSEYCNIHCW
ncbi:hypothetical protein VTI74DRAFT_4442 [Chaetomium olivicolor]